MHTLTLELLYLLSGHSLPPSPPQLTAALPPSRPTASVKGTEDVDIHKIQRKERVHQMWVALLGSAQKCTSFESSTTEGLSQSLSEWVAMKCDPSLTDAIQALSDRFHMSSTVVVVTMYMLALHCFLEAKPSDPKLSEIEMKASELRKSSDLVIGCAFNNRRRGQKSMVGHMVSLLPLRVDFSKSPNDVASLLKQVHEGVCLILEGNVSLPDLVPLLPCLQSSRDASSSSSSSSGVCRDKLSSASPLQTVFSYLSLPQETHIPKAIHRPGDGAEVQCHLQLPRSCDAHVDLFLEVRPPHSWSGEGSESSYLFTWEYRVGSLSRTDISTLHNSVTNLLSLGEDLTLGEEVALGVGLSITSTLHSPDSELCLSKSDSEAAANSYEYTAQAMKNVSFQSNITSTSKPPIIVPSSHNDLSIVHGSISQQTTQPECFIEKFFTKASAIPNQLAFKCGTQQLTYRETATMVDKLARVLLGRGVRAGDHIGLVMQRSHLLYIALLTALRCGAAYVPMSLHNPPERIMDMLALADSRLVLTDSETLQKKLSAYEGEYVCVDSELTSEQQSQYPATEGIPPLWQGSQTAYIIFTSGTTGTPKGVAITNDSLSLTLENFQHLVSPHDTALTLAACTVAWDGHVLDSLGPLLNGACLLVSETLSISEGITHAFMSPSAASVVKFPKSLRSLIVGGEAFTRACYENAKSVPKLLTVYGPTEATVFVASEQVVGPDVSKYLSNLGKAVANVSLMVCDAEQRPLPLGVEGELCIGGPLVSKVGYYKNPEKTKAAFVPSPVSGCGTVYRTGDWARMLPDGRVEFLGRTDDQVKLRGMRFQLLEVENTLRRHPQVNMAAAVVRHLGTPSAQLLGFATPKSVDTDSLFSFARAHLPSYMVPSSITVLDEMPLKSEWKVDRVALINLGLPTTTDTTDTNINYREISGTDTVPMVAETARRLAGIFGQVLNQPSYSPTADFFTHGGQSLLLLRLLQLVKTEVDCDIQLADLLQHPTPLALAKVIVSTAQQQTTHPLPQRGSSLTGNGLEEEEEKMTKSHVQRKPTQAAVARSLTSASALAGFDYLDPVPEVPLSERITESLTALGSDTLHGGGGEVSLEALSRQIQAETGFVVPPAALEKYHDVEVLKVHIKLNSLLRYFKSAKDPVVKLRPPNQPNERPLIFVHAGIIGWALPYATLARSLKRYSIALQRTQESPTDSFEAMAAYYVKVIQSVQPEGAYTLIGVCYGAMLLYEIARQLTDAGATIELAVFINHSPAIENHPAIFSPSGGEPLPNTFVDPVVFFRMILRLPLRHVRRSEVREKEGRGEEGGGEGGGSERGKEEVEQMEHHQQDLQEEAKREGLEVLVKSVVQDIKASPESCWIPFTTQELEDVYLGFFRRLRCAWFGYTPRPGAAIEHAVLIRNPEHPLFHSHDYGLNGLLRGAGAGLSIVTAPEKMGLLSEKQTFDFVRGAILCHL